MNKIKLVTFCICLSLALSTIGQTSFQQKQENVKTIKNKMTTEELKDFYKSVHSRLPMKRGNISVKPENSLSESRKNTTLSPLPEDMIFPNESDEVQAILMTWLYDSYTVSNNEPAEQLFDGLGISFYAEEYYLEPVVSTPDVSPSSPYAKLFAKLANGIQQHAQVWINIWTAEDSVAIKNFMEERGTPLTNYRFFVNPGNSFWYRDCGPVAFYYGEQDSIGFIDFEYYGGRPLDDQIAKRIGEQAGFKVFTNSLEFEGGNILLDGAGTLFTTNAVYSANRDTYGLYELDENSTYGFTIQQKTPLSNQQVNDSLTKFLNLSRCVVLPALQYDGGTGHIDLYCDMWDENTFVSTKHPESMANLSDPKKVESNMDSLCRMETMFGVKYHNTRIPLPRKNNGTWYTSQTDYNRNYTRSYSNHTFVNDAIMQPVFYDETMSGSRRGDVEGNKEAIEIMKQRYPGYVFEEIDVREFDGFGGAIHCITKQIPAENPVRIYHDPVRWWKIESGATIPTYRVIAQNKSGIASAKLVYRLSTEDSWQQIELSADEGNMFTAQIPFSLSRRDTLLYYIEVTSNNGKTITKPMTAPQGYYTTVYGTDVEGISEEDVYVSNPIVVRDELEGIGDAIPNPASDVVRIQFSKEFSNNVNFKLISSKGQTLLQDSTDGKSELTIDISKLKSGIYWLIFTSGNQTTARKIVVER